MGVSPQTWWLMVLATAAVLLAASRAEGARVLHQAPPPPPTPIVLWHGSEFHTPLFPSLPLTVVYPNIAMPQKEPALNLTTN
jgi:hypothetical protein